MTDGRKHRYLIFEAPRAQLADALLEYREFARQHPDDPLTPVLLDVSRKVAAALREERRVMRATGQQGKPNAELHITAKQRRDLGRRRHARLAEAVAA